MTIPEVDKQLMMSKRSGWQYTKSPWRTEMSCVCSSELSMKVIEVSTCSIQCSWFKTTLSMVFLSLCQIRKMPKWHFLDGPSRSKLCHISSHPGSRLEGEEGGGNCCEPHKKLWQCPPVLKSGVGLCHLQESKCNQIFSESFIFICFFNSS